MEHHADTRRSAPATPTTTPTKRKRSGSSPALEPSPGGDQKAGVVSRDASIDAALTTGAVSAGGGVEGFGSPRTRMANHFAELNFDSPTMMGAGAVGPRRGGGHDGIDDDTGWALDGAASSGFPSAFAKPLSAPLPHISSALDAASSSIAKPKAKMKRRSKSPPLASTPSSLAWDASEITGHLLDDPDDDGTGLNGVGFRPTALEAQRREARRKEQVERWRRTVTAEERRRRGERRLAGDAAASSGRAVAEDDKGVQKPRRVVRFASVEKGDS
ncbi:MAG: hypothetical protein M1828_003747 [Chrysothrix sp. TS-e1954]|nr:MAG: hypothetical protein M1828_003747 [Chrysothrix sp. TS-e1954]